MSIKQIINPAGGLYYHIKAFKYQKQLWSTFRQSLAFFLEQWETSCENLVIVGGSGGYCLNAQFLQRFRRISLVDPDPLAATIFKWRFKVKIHSCSPNYIEHGRVDLNQIQADFPNNAILFSNILGQLPYLTQVTEDSINEMNQNFHSLKCDWASYHDLLSIHFETKYPQICWPLVIQSNSNRKSIDKLQQQLSLRPLKVHIIDHYTDRIFKNFLHTQKFYWQRTPQSYHIIEAISHSC